MNGVKSIENLKPNLYLCGFMGTGKSTLGRRLAERLNYAFLDSDAEIAKSFGMSVKDIFSKYGEDKFRELERRFMDGGHPESECVVACGGGLVCRDSMPELVRSKGVSVVLFSRPEEILARISNNDKRPLLNVENPMEEIRRLMSERRPFYMRSGIAIVADSNIKLTEEHILRIYRKKLALISRSKLKNASRAG